jgi:hypothetical protein
VERWKGEVEVGELREYAVVRVRKLLQPASEYDGWRMNCRAPRIGDVGTIGDVLHTAGYPDGYVVESSDPDGITVWLGDFAAEEIESVD